MGELSLAAYRRSASPQTAWLEKARLAYWTAHETNPLEADYLLQLALVEGTWADARGAAGERARHMEGARQHLDAAARLAPRDPQVWNEWGKLCLREGRFSGAVPMFERSLGLDQTSPDTHLFYADALAGVGQYARALPEYEKARALGLDRPLPAISGRALALAQLHRFEEAVAANMEALEISPEDYTSRKNLALLHDQLGDIAQAAAYADAAAAVADASEKPAIEAFASGLRARLRDRGERNRDIVGRRE
jgi:tetratricopeptide (TPR) repeat protein